MTEAELFARHACVARSGREPLFAPNVARLLVEDAAANGLVVLGMEGVRLVEGQTVPDLGAILDLSDGLRRPWREAVRASRRGALGFLDRQPADLLFSTVLAAEGEFG